MASHGGILNMALYAILGIPVQADSGGPRFMFHNTTFTTFTYEPEHHNWRMLNFDDRQHWKEDDVAKITGALAWRKQYRRRAPSGLISAASLALAGHRVTFIEQPKVAGELAQRGLAAGA